MVTPISWALELITGLLSIPVAVLFVEVIAALKTEEAAQVESPSSRTAKRVVVIVPAHDESVGIVPTIADIRPQLNANDRLIVVADNCTDDTAAVAESAGAEVIVRYDLGKIGKGYALGWGISHISADPPEFVVFIDADCRIQSDAIEKLTKACSNLRKPVQACFLMKTPENSPIDHSFAEFFFLLRNWVRPLGLRHLNCPVQLMGTGMIFPWDVIRSAPLASGNLVEDLKLGLDLAEVGKAPHFLPFVRVTSDFPVTAKGTDSQRQRWVQGHIGMILKTVPRLLFTAVTRQNRDLLVLTLDLLVPPLSLLGLLIVGTLVLSSLAAILGLPLAALIISTANLAVFALAIISAWRNFGRDVLPARVLVSVGPSIVGKLRLYGQMLLGRTAVQWVRTDRATPK
jgi:cellulose synthase/poly-beta-1,6-N-acetylglucosamine synthase-like glycosyltransferase